jgi:hypothetical protein
MTYPIDINQEMLNCFDNYYVGNDPKSLEVVLFKLREKGYSQMQSAFLLMEKLHLAFIEANLIVMKSLAWNGTETDQEFL